MVDFTKKTLLSAFKNSPEHIGSVCIEHTASDFYPPEMYDFDMVLIHVMDRDMALHEISHMKKGDLKLQIHTVSVWSMERWLVDGENRNMIQWMIQGEIVKDSTGYLNVLRDRILQFANPLREQRMIAEFALFLRNFLQAKQFMKMNHELDAYQRVLESLRHWAGIVLIEKGMHPEVSVWNQIHDLNLGVFKLYEELTISQETVGQRVELLLLASEFSVMTKMKEYCSLLLRILSSREEPWNENELVEHPELHHIRADLPMLLQKMLQRSLVREVEVLSTESEETDHEPSIELYYLAG
ncbi:nucleotidyltransferase-like protein [Paenibacillus terrigena]|uniref:nucleotidyltransferase-like protein n=1 Tax=Paenibacillus terrigena TaxID=369333 RepID=UPI0028D25AC2|nr:nucleotidyltransferase-like protein [Paenibacillus terrigena]